LTLSVENKLYISIFRLDDLSISAIFGSFVLWTIFPSDIAS